MKHWLSQLRLAHKFLVVGLIALVMMGLPTADALRAEVSAWQTARHSAQGIEPAGHLLKLIQLTQQHRGLSANVLGGNQAMRADRETRQRAVDDVLAQVGESLAPLATPALTKQWQSVAAQWGELARAVGQGSVDGPQSFARHTALIERQLGLLADVADTSGMSRDPHAHS